MPADLAVLGLDHLGLSAAQAATAQGIGTVGYTPDPDTATALRTGRPVPAASLTAAEVRRLLARGFTASSDPAVLGRVRTALVCAPTPLGPDRALDLAGVRAAARALAPRLRRHALVVLESPVLPGTTEEVLRPLLEEGSGLRAGRDFHLAYSPSRADPGRAVPHDREAGGPAGPSGGPGQGPAGATYGGHEAPPRVVGGFTPACTEAAVAFYGRLAERPVRARGTREAETARMLETNLRHVTTALVNEMAFLCHDLGVDLWDVLRCAEVGPLAAHAVRRGPGPAGPGAAVDPGLLPRTPRVPGYPTRLVELARDINDRMPGYLTQRAATLLNEHGKSLRGARLLLLGVTARPDGAEREGSPAEEIAVRLRELGARLSYHDPFVPHWAAGGRGVPRVSALYEAAAEADLTLLLQHHATYDLQGLAAKAQLLLDARGATPAGAAHRL